MKISELQAWCARLVRDKKNSSGTWVHFDDDFFMNAYREALASVVARNPESSTSHEWLDVPANSRVRQLTTTSDGRAINSVLSVDAWAIGDEFQGFMQQGTKGDVTKPCDATQKPTHFWVDETTEDRIWLNASNAQDFKILALVSVFPALPAAASAMATMDVPLKEVHHAALADYIVARMNGTTARGLTVAQTHFGLAKEHVVAEMAGDRLNSANK